MKWRKLSHKLPPTRKMILLKWNNGKMLLVNEYVSHKEQEYLFNTMDQCDLSIEDSEEIWWLEIPAFDEDKK